MPEQEAKMKWLYRLEYKYGNHYIKNLMTIVVAGMALVYVADMMLTVPLTGINGLLSLNRSAILNGQVWRLITFIFVPTNTNVFWMLISIYFYYMIGRTLEYNWGGFRFTLYYLIGILGAIISAFITGYADNSYLNMSLFLAFATLVPDAQFLIFFIVPIKAKWMLIFYAVIIGLNVIQAFIFSPLNGLYALVALAFSLVNYVLFFGRTAIDMVKDEIRVRKNRRDWQNRNR